MGHSAHLLSAREPLYTWRVEQVCGSTGTVGWCCAPGALWQDLVCGSDGLGGVDHVLMPVCSCTCLCVHLCVRACCRAYSACVPAW